MKLSLKLAALLVTVFSLNSCGLVGAVNRSLGNLTDTVSNLASASASTM